MDEKHDVEGETSRRSNNRGIRKMMFQGTNIVQEKKQLKMSKREQDERLGERRKYA